MNIAYITQLTNLRISDKNPIDYVATLDNDEFRSKLQAHLMPQQLLEWAQKATLPDDALDRFVELRVDLIVNELALLLPGVPFRVFDSRQGAEPIPTSA